ncbi:SEL1-like repeat protein [Zooshikella ganghwensis]|uniref:SEL1-like repeat protein n=1 Tax=Zooshikella ganghwensis TaxID=202772 RepID=UPI00048172E7|nr:SEL1-like repeat protein [Zooshikella ganghwensis]
MIVMLRKVNAVIAIVVSLLSWTGLAMAGRIDETTRVVHFAEVNGLFPAFELLSLEQFPPFPKNADVTELATWIPLLCQQCVLLDEKGQVRWLAVHGQPVISIEPLLGLQHLEGLQLVGVGLNQLTIPASWQTLKVLELNDNPLQSLIGLDNLQRLSYLNIAATSINALPGIEQLSHLQFIGMEGTSLTMPLRQQITHQLLNNLLQQDDNAEALVPGEWVAFSEGDAVIMLLEPNQYFALAKKNKPLLCAPSDVVLSDHHYCTYTLKVDRAQPESRQQLLHVVEWDAMGNQRQEFQWSISQLGQQVLQLKLELPDMKLTQVLTFHRRQRAHRSREIFNSKVMLAEEQKVLAEEASQRQPGDAYLMIKLVGDNGQVLRRRPFKLEVVGETYEGQTDNEGYATYHVPWQASHGTLKVWINLAEDQTTSLEVPLRSVPAKRPTPDFLAKALKGDAAAQFQLAQSYHYGGYFTINKQDARHWYEKSAEQGWVYSQLALAEFFLKADQLEKALFWAQSAWQQHQHPEGAYWAAMAQYQQQQQWNESSIQLLKTASDKGSSQAALQLAKLQLTKQVAGTWADTAKLLQHAIKLNPQTAEAYWLLAQGLWQGQGGRNQEVAIFQLMLRAGRTGWLDAQRWLGMSALAGWGQPRNIAQATFWLTKAAAQQDKTAQQWLADLPVLASDLKPETDRDFQQRLWLLWGLRCWYGIAGEHDLQAAQYWFEKSAELGSAQSYYYLGQLHQQRDQAFEAYRYFQYAAREGNSGAMLKLADLYYQGIQSQHGAFLLAPQPHEALRWYQEAANLGEAKAQLILAQWYEQDESLQGSASDIIHLYLQAAAQGEVAAQYALWRWLQSGNETAVVLIPAELARDYLQQAASQGHQKAQRALGQYLIATGQPQLAADWLEKAAHQGDAQALLDWLSVTASDKPLAEQLLSTLESSTSALLRIAAVEAIGMRGFSSVADALTAYLPGADDALLTSIMATLHKLDQKVVVPALVSLLQQHELSKTLKALIIDHLALMKSPEAVKGLAAVDGPLSVSALLQVAKAYAEGAVLEYQPQKAIGYYRKAFALEPRTSHDAMKPWAALLHSDAEDNLESAYWLAELLAVDDSLLVVSPQQLLVPPVYWWRHAALQGHARSAWALGQWLLEKGDRSMARYWLARAAEQDKQWQIPALQYWLRSQDYRVQQQGVAQLQALLTQEPDLVKEVVADLLIEDKQAVVPPYRAFLLAQFYQLGLGVEQDVDLAAHWLVKASTGNWPPSDNKDKWQGLLSSLQQWQHQQQIPNQPAPRAQAVQLAAAGNTEAVRLLIAHYQQYQDPAMKKLVNLWQQYLSELTTTQRQASDNDIAAQRQLGDWLEQSASNEYVLQQALLWYTKAAQQQEPYAQVMAQLLSIVLEPGPFEPLDRIQQLANEQSNPYAQRALALLFARQHNLFSPGRFLRIDVQQVLDNMILVMQSDPDLVIPSLFPVIEQAYRRWRQQQSTQNNSDPYFEKLWHFWHQQWEQGQGAAAYYLARLAWQDPEQGKMPWWQIIDKALPQLPGGLLSTACEFFSHAALDADQSLPAEAIISAWTVCQLDLQIVAKGQEKEVTNTQQVDTNVEGKKVKPDRSSEHYKTSLEKPMDEDMLTLAKAKLDALNQRITSYQQTRQQWPDSPSFFTVEQMPNQSALRWYWQQKDQSFSMLWQQLAPVQVTRSHQDALWIASKQLKIPGSANLLQWLQHKDAMPSQFKLIFQYNGLLHVVTIEQENIPLDWLLIPLSYLSLDKTK